MVTLRKCVLILLDVSTTVLALMAGLRENPVLVFVTGRYDVIRSRFQEQRINYRIFQDDHLNATLLPNLTHVGGAYRFYSTPTREPNNLGTDRSTCLRVNSMNTTILALHYDDWFGRGARREQIFIYSISAPHCRVLNVQPEWLQHDCPREAQAITTTINNTLATVSTPYGCHEYILDRFDALAQRPVIQAGVAADFGIVGVPFLHCLGRPLQRFQFVTDLLVLQSFWAGGSHHVEVQSSRCWANPVVRTRNWENALFRVTPADASAQVVMAVPAPSMSVRVLEIVYGIISVAMILRSIYTTLALRRLVLYAPRSVRRRLFGILPSPSVELLDRVLPLRARLLIVNCYGALLLASDQWMNHWLYITLSVLDALANVRTTYSVLEMGSWMLANKKNMENFLFVCTAVAKLTWLMCLAHTVFRALATFLFHIVTVTPWLRKLHAFSRRGQWFLDTVALFSSYKVYAVLVVLTLVVLDRVNGSPTFMQQQKPLYKQPVYGGYPAVAPFWGNEIVCDLLALFAVLLTLTHGLGATLLVLLRGNRYRMVASNRVLRLLQARFLVVGWDVFVVIEALGIEAHSLPRQRLKQQDKTIDGHDKIGKEEEEEEEEEQKEEEEEKEEMSTHCSFGALLQQLYASGPSGFVELVGDTAFAPSTQPPSVSAPGWAPGVLRYTPELAVSMGLLTEPPPFLHLPQPQPQPPPLAIVPQVRDDDATGCSDEKRSSLPACPLSWDVVDCSASGAQRTMSTGAAVVPAAIAISTVTTAPPPPPSTARASLSQRTLRIYAESRYGRILLVDAAGALRVNPRDRRLEFVVQDVLPTLSRDELRALLASRATLRIS